MISELFWTIGFLILALSLLLKFIYNGNKGYWKKRGIIHIESGWSILKKLRNATNFLQIETVFYQKLGNEPYGGTVEFRNPTLIVRDPEFLRRILIKDFDHFMDRRAINDPFFKKIFLQGEEWRANRTLLSPTFTTGKIRRMFDQVFLKCSDNFVSYIKEELEKTSNNELDLQSTFGKYTLSVISSAAFGMEISTFKDSPFADKVRQMLTVPKMAIIKLAIFILMPKVAEFLKLQLLVGENFEFLQSLVKKNIEYREKNQEEIRNDFFQLMLEAKWGSLKKEDESEDLGDFEKYAISRDPPEKGSKKRQLDDDDIFANAFLFLVAGFETVAAAVGFVIYNLTVYQDLQEKVYKEVKGVTDQNGGKLTYDGLQQMELLDRFLSETLRLYPPAFTTDRKCSKPYKIPGTETIIEEGTTLTIPIYSLHRDPAFFPDPLKFNPDRFLPENKDQLIPYTYTPFGNGPRNCIGMRFARTEVKSLAANFLLNMKIQPCAKTKIPNEPVVLGGTLKMADGMIFKITPRSI